MAGGALATASLALAGIPSIAREAHAVSATSIGATVEPGSMQIPASYVVYKDGSTYLARNGQTGQNEFSGTDAATVIQRAWNAAPTGTTVFHKAATYSIATQLVLNRSDITLDAESGTIFQATMDIGAPFPAGWYGMVLFGDNTGTALQRSNIIVQHIVFDANTKPTPAVTIVGCKNIHFKNCTFKNSGAAAVGGSIVIGGNDSTIALIAATTKMVKFLDCEFGPTSSYGLYFDGGTGSPVSPVIDGIWVERCYVHDCDTAGISNGMKAARVIARVRILNSYFELNKKVIGGFPSQQAHVDDTNRVGWVDFLASGNYFGPAGSTQCGGISDHNGIGIRWLDNFFDLGTNGIWWGAIGDARTGANRSERVRIRGNIVISGGGMDFDSSKYVRITHNVFYRVGLQAIASFGEHIETIIHDNDFIECGQTTVGNGAPIQEYNKAGVSCGRGTDVRRNIFRDDQGTKTQLYGVHEVTGDIGTEVNIYESNDFTNSPGGVSGGPLVIQNYSYIIRNNRNGINPQGVTSITVGASPFTYTNSDSVPEAVYIRGGTVSDISKNATTIFTATPATVWLEPGESVVVTYSAAPTMLKDRK